MVFSLLFWYFQSLVLCCCRHVNDKSPCPPSGDRDILSQRFRNRRIYQPSAFVVTAWRGLAPRRLGCVARRVAEGCGRLWKVAETNGITLSCSVGWIEQTEPCSLEARAGPGLPSFYSLSLLFLPFSSLLLVPLEVLRQIGPSFTVFPLMAAPRRDICRLCLFLQNPILGPQLRHAAME